MPCCIDRMRFSPRFSIRRKKDYSFFLLFFFLFFAGTCSSPNRTAPSGMGFWLRAAGLFLVASRRRRTSWPAPADPSSGGSSAVEQRTVKCASAAILWSGVQISLSGFFFYCYARRPFLDGWFARDPTTVIRSYHGESTASHPNCEVKHRWARSVLR